MVVVLKSVQLVLTESAEARLQTERNQGRIYHFEQVRFGEGAHFSCCKLFDWHGNDGKCHLAEELHEQLEGGGFYRDYWSHYRGASQPDRSCRQHPRSSCG